MLEKDYKLKYLKYKKKYLDLKEKKKLEGGDVVKALGNLGSSAFDLAYKTVTYVPNTLIDVTQTVGNKISDKVSDVGTTLKKAILPNHISLDDYYKLDKNDKSYYVPVTNMKKAYLKGSEDLYREIDLIN